MMLMLLRPPHPAVARDAMGLLLRMGTRCWPLPISAKVAVHGLSSMVIYGLLVMVDGGRWWQAAVDGVGVWRASGGDGE